MNNIESNRAWEIRSDIKSCINELDVDLNNPEELKKVLKEFTYALTFSISGGVRIDRAKELAKLSDDFLELRAFNEDAELHAIKLGDAIVGRVRRDDDKGFGTEYLEEEHMLWGRYTGETNTDGTKAVLTEARGTRVEIPVEIVSGISGAEQCRAAVKVRNYVSEQATTGEPFKDFGFSDYRLVDFEVQKED